MPKDKSSHKYSSHKARDYSYKVYSNHGKGPAAPPCNSLDEDNTTLRRDWDDTICPICMERPHNAVLLICSSYEKGCRPYMCDTSYRHSNCLDQYCKSHSTVQKAPVNGQDNGSVEATYHFNTSGTDDVDNNASVTMVLQPSSRVHMAGTSEEGQSQASGSEFLNNKTPKDLDRQRTTLLPGATGQLGTLSLQGCNLLGLVCPLCRGHVRGWIVIKAARTSLNKTIRSCAQEACSFAGCYADLRAHARREHPTACPAQVDPARQHDWRLLERRHDLEDVLSSIRSALPGSTILGDHVVDDQSDELLHDFPSDEGHLLTVFLLFQAFGSGNTPGRGFPHFRFVRSQHRTGNSRWSSGDVLQPASNNGENNYSGTNNP